MLLTKQGLKVAVLALSLFYLFLFWRSQEENLGFYY